MTLRVIKAGILSSLQGLGRRGYARFGVNAGGAMDTVALRLANILLGNDEGEAAVEIHFPAGRFEVEGECTAVLAGADFGATLNGAPLELWREFQMAPGDNLSFTTRISGGRAYLAVAGGFDAEEWLGSKSTNLAAGMGGLARRPLKAGDLLITRVNDSRPTPHRSISRGLVPRYSKFPTVRIVPGPEFDLLANADVLESTDFVISSESNRMGYRLMSEPIEMAEPYEMVSSPVTFGTIQLPPGGRPIVLMADHQTSGGYPRIATVITHDLPVLAQLSAGDKVAFRFVEVGEAQSLLNAFEREIAFLRAGCRLTRNRN